MFQRQEARCDVCVPTAAICAQTRQVAQLSQRDRAAGRVSFGQKCEIRPHSVPENHEPIVTEFGMTDNVGESYPFAKFYYDPIRGFRSPPIDNT